MTTRTGSAPLGVCTIISHNYLSHARTCLQSVLQHEPDAHAYVLVVDRVPEGVEFGFNVRVIDPAELGFENWDELCFQYDATELCTAVKPRLMQLLMHEYGEQQLVYLDPDIVVFRPFDALKQVLKTSSLVLTPHMLKPVTDDGCRPNEQDVLISGAYNLGFLALNQCEQTRVFLEWWDKHLQNDCRVDISQGLFVDQKWLDLAPSFFDRTTILRDDSYNVAFWNLHERTLTRGENGFAVNGKPLTFYHFSGFDPTKPRTLSKHQTRTDIDENPALKALVDRYTAQQLENGYQRYIALGYGYGHFDNGMEVNLLLRHIYLDLSAAQRAQFGNPFQTGQPHSFLEWVTSPQAENQISPFLQEYYIMHPEVVTRFPDVLGKDKKSFIEWASGVGLPEVGYELLPAPSWQPAADESLSQAGTQPSTLLSSDIYEGPYHSFIANHARLKEMWERKRTVHALEEWAKALEAALLAKGKHMRLPAQVMSFLDSAPIGAARWLRGKLNPESSNIRKN